MDPGGPLLVADLGNLDCSPEGFLPCTIRIKGCLEEDCCPSPPSITLPLWDQAKNFTVYAYKSGLNIHLPEYRHFHPNLLLNLNNFLQQNGKWPEVPYIQTFYLL
jgi:hypothetical protein